MRGEELKAEEGELGRARDGWRVRERKLSRGGNLIFLVIKLVGSRLMYKSVISSPDVAENIAKATKRLLNIIVDFARVVAIEKGCSRYLRDKIKQTIMSILTHGNIPTSSQIPTYSAATLHPLQTSSPSPSTKSLLIRLSATFAKQKAVATSAIIHMNSQARGEDRGSKRRRGG